MATTRISMLFGWFFAIVLAPLAASSAHAQMWFHPVYGPWGGYEGMYFPSYPGPVYPAAMTSNSGQSAALVRASAPAYAASASEADARPNYYSEDYAGPKSPTNAPSKVAYIRVRVPANAELWINNDKRTQSGVVREFVTPALDPDHIYVYNVKARWREEGGIAVEKTLRVRTISGTRVTVNFARPPVEQPRRTVPAAITTAPPSPPRIVQQPVNWTANVAPRSLHAPSP